MGCNTSSEAKTATDDKNKAEESQAKAGEKSTDQSEPGKEVEAATKIQAVFRGHKTRKTMSMKAASNKPEPEPSKAELEAEFRADDKELCSAATKIQASFRGHQARRQAEQEAEQDVKTQAELDQEQQDKEDIEKIDLGDPDLNKAATKIQASFRGHKVRKDVVTK